MTLARPKSMFTTKIDPILETSRNLRIFLFNNYLQYIIHKDSMSIIDLIDHEDFDTLQKQ